MAAWGVHVERRDLSDRVIGLGRPGVPDLGEVRDRAGLSAFLTSRPVAERPAQARLQAAQIWSFVHEIEIGDVLAVMVAGGSEIRLAEVKGPCTCVEEQGRGMIHRREVDWLAPGVPMGVLDPDLRHSLLSLGVVNRLRCRAAEERLRRLATSLQPPPPRPLAAPAAVDRLIEHGLAHVGREAVRLLLRTRYWGGRCEPLVAAILHAEGYHVLAGGPGPDGGLDLIAGSGPLGFGGERLAVQVKAGRRPVTGVDLAAFEASMARHGAATGLVVSLAGFAGLNSRSTARGGFRIRLWDEEALLDAVLRVYERMPDAIRRDLPLRRVWVPDFA